MDRGRNISMGKDSIQPYENEEPNYIFLKIRREERTYVMSG